MYGRINHVEKVVQSARARQDRISQSERPNQTPHLKQQIRSDDDFTAASMPIPIAD
jgi:hypothetical protein